MGESVAPRSHASHAPAQTVRHCQYKSPSLLTLTYIIRNSGSGGYQDRRLGSDGIDLSSNGAGTRDDRIRQGIGKVLNGVSVPAAAQHFNIPPSTDIRRVALKLRRSNCILGRAREGLRSSSDDTVGLPDPVGTEGTMQVRQVLFELSRSEGAALLAESSWQGLGSWFYETALYSCAYNPGKGMYRRR